jgi:hypothetical protein
MENKQDLIICECHSTEHQIILSYSEDTDDKGNVYPMCYAHIHLNKHGFWQRLKHGVKYIFGYRSRYGDFDEFIFNPKDAQKLQELVDYLNKENVGNTIKPTPPPSQLIKEGQDPKAVH